MVTHDAVAVRTGAGARWTWGVLLVALVVLPNLFAPVQFRSTGGYLFYSNAFDEPTYLSYDGARLTASITHLAEYLVVVLHRAGLSGGYINLLLDLACPLFAVVVLRRLAARLGFSPLEQAVYPFVVVSVPILFGYANPYYTRLYNANYYSAGLSWITLPQGYYSPFFRTPEPQLSLCAVAVAIAVAWRLRSYVAALAVVPFVYPFVGLPYAFIVVGLWTYARLGSAISNERTRAAAALAVGYLAISVLVFTFYRVFVAGTTLAEFLPLTRLPLVSGTGIACCALYALVRSRLEWRLRRVALFVAAAPMAAANTQIVSGFVQAPHNLEQNFGVLAIAFLVVLAVHATQSRAAVAAAAVGACVLLSLYSAHVFTVNNWIWQRVPPSASLLDALRHRPESVVIGNPDLADVFSLLAPRLGFSAFARSQTLRGGKDDRGADVTEQRFQNYQCVKQQLVESGALDAERRAGIEGLDASFRYLNQDFPLIHLNRRTQFRQFFDPSQAPARCPPRSLALYPSIVVGPEIASTPVVDDLRRASDVRDDEKTVPIVTPASRWAFAAQSRLPAAASRSSAPLLDLRVELTVTRGCVGVGVLTADQSAFVNQLTVEAAPAPQIADLVFRGGPQPEWSVLENCSAAGASEARVAAARLFPVREVTVRMIGAGHP